MRKKKKFDILPAPFDFGVPVGFFSWKIKNKKKTTTTTNMSSYIETIRATSEMIEKNRPKNIEPFSKGFLKTNVFCLKLDHGTETFNFFVKKFKKPCSVNSIYVLRYQSHYAIIGSHFNFGESLILQQKIQPTSMINYRLWSVPYLSMFYRWIQEGTMQISPDFTFTSQDEE